MTTYPSIRLKVDKFITPTKLQAKLLELINDKSVQIGVNKIIGDRANKYVPMKSGALRESIHITPKTISWGEGLDYGRYQYHGEVYGRNLPIFADGKRTGTWANFGGNQTNGFRVPIMTGSQIIGWYSPAGVEKVPTGRELGVPGEYKGWTFGYTTSDTHHHWIDEMLTHERRGMMNQITSYLKKEARKRNL